MFFTDYDSFEHAVEMDGTRPEPPRAEDLKHRIGAALRQVSPENDPATSSLRKGYTDELHLALKLWNGYLYYPEATPRWLAYVFNAGHNTAYSSFFSFDAVQEVEGFQLLLSKIGKAVEKEYNDPIDGLKKKWMFELGPVSTLSSQRLFDYFQLPEEDIVTSESFDDEASSTEPLAVLIIPNDRFIEFLQMGCAFQNQSESLQNVFDYLLMEHRANEAKELYLPGLHEILNAVIRRYEVDMVYRLESDVARRHADECVSVVATVCLKLGRFDAFTRAVACFRGIPPAAFWQKVRSRHDSLPFPQIVNG